MTTNNDVALYVEAHYAASDYEHKHNAEFTKDELIAFVRAYIENEGGVSPV